MEWVGCEIDDEGKCVAGKIEKKVVRQPNGQVWEWVDVS